MASAGETSSYLSPALQAPDFHPTQYANTLVLATNNARDSPLDLSTPLSRVLFDVQEVDTHLDRLTTQAAQPLVQHTAAQQTASTRVLARVEEQVARLQESQARLARDVGARYAEAELVRRAAVQLLRCLRLGRAVQRVVGLGRQLQGAMEEVERSSSSSRGYGRFVAAAQLLLELRDCFAAGEGDGLARVDVAVLVRQDIGSPAERALVERCRAVVREFSMGGLVVTAAGAGEKTFAQVEETKARAAAAMQTLYLLSPVKSGGVGDEFEPTLLLAALNNYLQTALTSSLAALTRALATLPTLDRALVEVSARCQNIIALETLLESIKVPVHPLLPSSSSPDQNEKDTNSTSNLLQPLLRHLDTSSLPSYFWRSVASQLTSRVQEILSRGGVSARTLRSNKDRVKESIREAVDRGYRGKFTGKSQSEKGSWEREVAVMVGSVMGPLGR